MIRLGRARLSSLSLVVASLAATLCAIQSPPTPVGTHTGISAASRTYDQQIFCRRCIRT